METFFTSTVIAKPDVIKLARAALVELYHERLAVQLVSRRSSSTMSDSATAACGREVKWWFSGVLLDGPEGSQWVLNGVRLLGGGGGVAGMAGLATVWSATDRCSLLPLPRDSDPDHRPGKIADHRPGKTADHICNYSHSTEK